MNDDLKYIDEIAFEALSDFEVKKFKLTSAGQEGDEWEAIYVDNGKLKGTQDFMGAKAVKKGYEPVDVGVKGEEILVTFERI